MSETILVVEDEPKIAALLHDYLVEAGYQSHCIDHGDEVMPWLEQNRCDAMLLDLMLPGTDGITLCKQIRSSSDLPILMLTAKVEEIDRLLGLELGADDYICKPFSPREVIARLKAVLRRYQKSVSSSENLSGLVIDENTYTVDYENKKIEFTAVEFQLLSQLANEPGRIFSRQQLMNAMYSDNRIVSDRTIDSHIKKIRKKFQSTFPDVEFIHSVYGVGYKLDID